MMGRQSGQMSMLILDIEELIPGNHLLRQINQLVSFDFIYDLVEEKLRKQGSEHATYKNQFP